MRQLDSKMVLTMHVSLMNRNDNYNYLQGAVLPLRKRESAKYAFDDGLMHYFPDSQPRHIQFWCKTDSPQAESCNLRLYKKVVQTEATSRLLSNDDGSSAAATCKLNLPFAESDKQ